MDAEENALRKSLRNIVGRGNVSHDYFDVSTYCKENVAQNVFGRGNFKPSVVVRPMTVEQISRIIRLANEMHIPVIPRGGGTGYSGGAAPTVQGMVVDLSGMNRVLEVDAETMIVKVQAGVKVRWLNDMLRKVRGGLWWPHDPGSREWATVGGVISTRGTGTYSTKYGAALDTVTGLKVVVPTGEIITLGSKVKPSATGYDLIRLFTNAEGTLGIIAEATLKVYRIPEVREIVIAAFKKVGDACAAAAAILGSGLVPESLMVECRDRFQKMARNEETKLKVDLLAANNEAFMIASFGGSADVVKFSVQKSLEVSTELGGLDIESKAIRDAYWDAKTVLVRELGTGKKYHAVDVAVPTVNAQKMYDAYIKTAKQHGLQVYGVRFYIQHPTVDPPTSPSILMDDSDHEELKRYQEWTIEFSKTGSDLGGTMSSILGVGVRLNSVVDYELADALGVMRKLKTALDPNNIMNPGKKIQ